MAEDRRSVPSGATGASVELENIFVRYLDPVYRFVYRRVGNREDAEDLTSQVFLKAAQQLDGSRTEQSIAGWLFTVARTVLADHWRTYYRMPVSLVLDDARLSEASLAPRAHADSESSDQLLEMVLQSLPPRYRQTLELRFLKGYSINEAAAELSVSPANLKVLQHRALARAAALGLPEGPGRAYAGTTDTHDFGRSGGGDGLHTVTERTAP